MNRSRCYEGKLLHFAVGQYADIRLTKEWVTGDIQQLPLINMNVRVTIEWDEPEREIEPGDKIHWSQNPSLDYEVMAVDGDWLWLKPLRHDGAQELPVSLNIVGRKHQIRFVT